MMLLVKMRAAGYYRGLTLPGVSAEENRDLNMLTMAASGSPFCLGLQVRIWPKVAV